MYKIVIVLNLWLVSCFANAAISNQLKDHPSPYLAMHADDPVAWQAWDADVLARAKRENKLIFVSIGYFACHWCHVMQRESYSDKTVAEHLNKSFIPVKIDRELNTALDAYLIEFVQRTRGHAGWPLNVFVTPEGNPVVGLTYARKDQFIDLLKQLITLWKKDSVYMQNMAAQAAAIQKSEKVQVTQKLDKGLVNKYQSQFLQQTLSYGDEMLGGFGEQTKFPMIAQLHALLSAYEHKPFEPIKQFILLTLNQMATKGLRDHIGGGFYRYTVDPDWQIPHYEKMLYTNAQLAVLYARAGDMFKRPDYTAVARETLNFMTRELLSKEGGMVASLSAVDNAGVEGGYYLWQKDTVHKLLNEKELAVIELLWNMGDAAQNESGYLPFNAISPDEVAKMLAQPVDEVMATIATAYAKLMRQRKSRSLPVDTKQLTSWNGLALYALSTGAQWKNGEQYLRAAKQLRNYLVNQLWDGKRLYRALGQFGAIGKAGLEDYAYAAKGLLQWAKVSGQKQDIKIVRQWLEIAWQRFYSATGWQLSDEMLLPYQMGVAIIEDNPMPSPSSTLIRTSFAVAQLTKDDKLLQRVKGALAIGHDLLQKQSFSYASQVELLSQYFITKSRK